jgi:hypothetical protein
VTGSRRRGRWQRQPRARAADASRCSRLNSAHGGRVSPRIDHPGAPLAPLALNIQDRVCRNTSGTAWPLHDMAPETAPALGSAASATTSC